MLNKKALLIQLSISTWDGKSTDSEAEKTVAEKYNVDVKVGRYRKQLVHSSKWLLDDVHRSAGALRAGHYKRTAYWSEGEQILPTKGFWPYQEWMKKAKPEFEEARKRFLDEYSNNWPSFALAQQSHLKNLWNIQDYPIPLAMEQKFSVRVDFRPVPDRGDFRVELDEDSLEHMRNELQKASDERLTQSMKDVWRRLYCTIQKVQAKLVIPVGQTGGIFRNSLIENVQEMVDLLPSLNVAGDPHLDEMLASIKKEIAFTDVDSLREDGLYREDVAQKAEEILEKMRGYV